MKEKILRLFGKIYLNGQCLGKKVACTAVTKENNLKIRKKMPNNESVAKYYVCRRMKQKGPN